MFLLCLLSTPSQPEILLLEAMKQDSTKLLMKLGLSLLLPLFVGLKFTSIIFFVGLKFTSTIFFCRFKVHFHYLFL